MDNTNEAQIERPFFSVVHVDSTIVPSPNTEEMYTNWDTSTLVGTRFDANLWKKYFNEYTDPVLLNKQGIRWLRVFLIQHTISVSSCTVISLLSNIFPNSVAKATTSSRKNKNCTLFHFAYTIRSSPS